MQNYKLKSTLNKVLTVPELVRGDVCMDETLETDSLKRALELYSDKRLDILAVELNITEAIGQCLKTLCHFMRNVLP